MTPTQSAASASASAAASASPTSASAADEALRSALVAVATTPACPYCKRAKQALAEAGVAFVEVDVGADEALRGVVAQISGKRTVPQIFLRGSSVGGCDDLLASMADGSFTAQLAEAQARGEPAAPPELLAEVAAARRRAAEAAASAQQHDPAAAAREGEEARLRDLAARLRAPVGEGGITRAEAGSGPRAFPSFLPHQLLSWLTAAGEPDPRATALALLAANLVAPAAAATATGGAPAAAGEAAARALGSGADAAEALSGGGGAAALMVVAEAPPPAAGQALNGHFQWQGPARPASEVAASLRARILALYDTHLSGDGRSVSYGALRADPRFAAFVDATAELQKVDLSPLSRPELIAFGVNLYNALVVHALVALRLTSMSAAQRATFYSRTAKYNIGGREWSADDLEHGLLRGNRAGASNVWNLLGLHAMAGGHWAAGDPRAKQVVSPVDPRIHFALVCGAKSCPPIRLYSAPNLEEGLGAAAEAFCAGEVEVDSAGGEVRLSKIFRWYAVDFGRNKRERLSYIASLLTEPAKGQLKALLAGGGDVRVSYKDYDWSLNGTD